MDLFNPPPIYNLQKMEHNLNVELLDNPYVQVVWEDYAENFTQEKIASVRHYFQKKYLTKSVNVITKTKIDKEDVTSNVDISHNLLDTNFQITLIEDFLNKKGVVEHKEEVLQLNTIVDNQLQSSDDEVTPFKRWFIKNIEFSNFLSYGKNQKIDFDKCDGITVVESDPPNFGGKTVLTVDLLLFLFFNETTKSSKAIEIFNRFTSDNKVNVKGEIVIDGDEYIIVRNIERKLSKKDEWNVKTELDFYKKLADGSLQNFTGEQRRETEEFIKKSIGTKDDFLMTILTTASNLEGLIDAKPTARGQVVSRFMGLDYLKRKEEIAKTFYSDFSKSMMSNIYNSEQLKTDNENYGVLIDEKKTEINTFNSDMVTAQDRIIKGQKYRDDLLSQKFNDIDQEISKLIPSKLEEEITDLEYQKTTLMKQIEDVKVVEPSSFYYEDQHDHIKENIKSVLKEQAENNANIKNIEELKSSVEGGIKCEHCGIELMNASITNAKIGELAGFITHKGLLEGLMQDLTSKEQGFVQLKKEFDEYEKNKLIKEKYVVSLESVELKISNIKDKLKKYFEIQDKIKTNKDVDLKIIQADLLLEKLEREKNEITNKISNHNFEIKNMTEKIGNNIKIINKIVEESDKEKIYKIYLELFGKNGISKMIMKTMMPLINSELQRLLEDSSHFRLEVRINDKNEVEFIMIDNNTQIEKDMSSGSGFERTIASLALRSVLSKVCSLPKPNIVVFDEVFGKVSNDNLEMVGEFFVKIKNYFEKIFVITHNPLVNNWADSVVKIKKVDNISQVEQ
jgi:DNA repair exonuclease SbcCD ATPase subunit